MVASIYSNKRGIYKDLYREIDADNNKKNKEANSPKKSPKGIYVDLYNQIGGKCGGKCVGKCVFLGLDESQKQTLHTNTMSFMQKFINSVYSKTSFIVSSANAEIKMLIFAFMVAKKPINNYIEDNISNYSYQG